MNYETSFKNTRPKSSTGKHTFRFALFVAFGLWLLYQITQSYIKMSVNTENFAIHLNNEQFLNFPGRKGRNKPLKSTHQIKETIFNAVKDYVTNPGEFSSEKETIFNGVKEQESIATEVLAKMKSNDDEVNKSENEDGSFTFLDENGIPELVREKLVGSESTQPGNETRV